MTDVFFEVCRKLREVVPEMALTTDVIVGFPGETEEEFEETCQFVRKVGFLKIHVFPYSKREKTVAAYMADHISDHVKKRRCRKLREVSDVLGKEFMQRLIGREYKVVVESESDGTYRGFTSNYLPVEFEATSDGLMNQKVGVRLESLLKSGRLRAVMI